MRSNAGFPRFRGKGRFDTFGFRQMCGIRFENERIRFRGMPGSLRVHLHRAIPKEGSIRSCTFHRDVKGWFVGFDLHLPESRLRRGCRTVGIDLGVATFAALSDGGFIPSLRAARRAERRVQVLQRALARKPKASKGRRKARIELARCHGAVGRVRANYLHQASARVVREYDIIVVEKLEVGNLARGALAKDIYDASWAKFLRMVRYKAECAGSRIIEVDPCGTSQECSGCGARDQKKLSERTHKCPNCGLVVDRDLNAARNILLRAGVSPGLRNVAETACVQAEISAIVASEIEAQSSRVTTPN
jgi:putative transposase